MARALDVSGPTRPKHERRASDVATTSAPLRNPAKHLRNLSIPSPPKDSSRVKDGQIDPRDSRPHGVPEALVVTSPPLSVSGTRSRRFSDVSYQTQEDNDVELSAPLAERNPLETYDVTWVHDYDVQACMVCQLQFNLFFRRHHCRSCGNVVCSRCAKSRRAVYGLLNQHRVCDECLTNGVWIDPRDVKAALVGRKVAEQRELERIKLGTY
ncbi:hypothetical protein ACHHYP_14610 [Achlya hypogyna]|uniref:FYVE-type domain-containing protein n=1 Tax=Achlya hypogyna TaxID=1202772 RepID=A0A1V9YCU7_ACHHY|nr:hypothetical protein ACHHYP_14610 [Achlya hypogyna]